MLRSLASGLAVVIALTGPVTAEMFDVQMLNRGDDGSMVFEPAFLRVAPGDTVRFLATDRGHNAETIAEMLPQGAAEFTGRINEEIEVTMDVAGLYGIRCKPHYAMGMVMTIAVGDANDVPETYFDGRVPKKAKERFEAQLGNL